MTTILDQLKHQGAVRLRAVFNQLQRWTRPLTGTLVGGALADVAKTKSALLVENALLRQQLITLQRQVKRPTLTPGDRVRLVLLARLTRTWQSALLIVQPPTLLRWHRQGSRENRLWGAERIRGELLKLGLRVGKRTVQRHMRGVRPPRRSGQTWATFLSTHAHAIWACDFLPVVDAGFRTLYAFFIVELGSRRVVHVGVTRHPTDAWVAHQLRAATPFGTKPRFLIRDNDDKFGAQLARVAATTRVEIVRIPVRAPRANAIAERFLGSVRRECLDHVLILSERHLLRVLCAYSTYFNTARPHQGIGQSLPEPAVRARTATSSATPIRAIPVLSGLHHDYQRIA